MDVILARHVFPIYLSFIHCVDAPSQFSITGHLPELFQEEAGAADFRWQEEYGTIARIKAPFGVSPCPNDPLS